MQLEALRPQLEALNVELIVLAADDPEALKRLRERKQLGARFVVDPEARELARLGVVHRGGGPDGKDVAIPQQWLIDRRGMVLDRFLSTDVRERRAGADLLAAVRRALGAAGSS